MAVGVTSLVNSRKNNGRRWLTVESALARGDTKAARTMGGTTGIEILHRARLAPIQLVSAGEPVDIFLNNIYVG